MVEIKLFHDGELQKEISGECILAIMLREDDTDITLESVAGGEYSLEGLEMICPAVAEMMVDLYIDAGEDRASAKEAIGNAAINFLKAGLARIREVY